jgi:hypothetical protein
MGDKINAKKTGLIVASMAGSSIGQRIELSAYRAET